MKFYEISQNNSGGFFVEDDKLCHRLYIEAETSEEATEIAEGLGCYWDGCSDGTDCSCCGDRWYPPQDEVELPAIWDKETKLKTIEEYAQHVANEYGDDPVDSRIFYKDGRILEISKEEKKCTDLIS